MRILTVTGIFPSRVAPARGVFVLQRTKALRDLGHEVQVIAPVPWVPPGPVPARYAKERSTPLHEEIDGIPVSHPRYLMIPKIGMRAQDRAYARGIGATVREAMAGFRPEILDVHYLYPDACGVARVARRVGLPYVCSARGSDVKQIGAIPAIGRRIRAALEGAAGVVAVSRDLAQAMRDLGLFEGEIRVIPNGIDPMRFHPRDRAAARRELGLPETGRMVVCVGHLAPVHGQDLIVEAFRSASMPADVTACLVGGGEDLAATRRKVARLNLTPRILLPGPVPHAQVPLWFAAADLSLHPGARAGSPNSILESLACGTPCLASDLPEMREALESERDGILVARDPDSIARGIAALLARGPDPTTRPKAPRTWAEVAAEVSALFEEARARGPTRPVTPSPRSGGATG